MSPPLVREGGTTKWLSETLKIQAVGAGFLAKSNLCSSEAELVGGIDRRKLSKNKLTRVNPLSHGVPPCQLPLLMGASRLSINFLFAEFKRLRFRRLNSLFCAETILQSRRAAVPAPFTQGSLIFVHELSILHRSRVFSRIEKKKMSAAQG